MSCKAVLEETVPASVTSEASGLGAARVRGKKAGGRAETTRHDTERGEACLDRGVTGTMPAYRCRQARQVGPAPVVPWSGSTWHTSGGAGKGNESSRVTDSSHRAGNLGTGLPRGGRRNPGSPSRQPHNILSSTPLPGVCPVNISVLLQGKYLFVRLSQPAVGGQAGTGARAAINLCHSAWSHPTEDGPACLESAQHIGKRGVRAGRDSRAQPGSRASRQWLAGWWLVDLPDMDSSMYRPPGKYYVDGVTSC